jgi:predicted TIM-barrel fold metal-dependent hydrolase
VKIVGLEEHYATPEVVRAWQGLDAKWQDSATKFSVEAELGRRLQSLGDERLAVMDDAGVDTQVLSLTSPGLFNLDAADAVALQSVCNDTAADAVARHPDRLRGFATLAPHRRRCATRTTRGSTTSSTGHSPPTASAGTTTQASDCSD